MTVGRKLAERHKMVFCVVRFFILLISVSSWRRERELWMRPRTLDGWGNEVLPETVQNQKNLQYLSANVRPFWRWDDRGRSRSELKRLKIKRRGPKPSATASFRLLTALSLLLIIAGDVELNPGPLFTDTLNTTDHFMSVRRALLKVRPQWWDIGLALGIPLHKLKEFSGTDVGKLMDQMLEVWLNHEGSTPTWERLVKALNDDTVEGGKPVAAEIEKQYGGKSYGKGKIATPNANPSTSTEYCPGFQPSALPKVETLLPTVDLTLLTEDDFFDVYTEVIPLASKWQDILLAMGLKQIDIDRIHSRYTGLHDCLKAALIGWLKKRYNVERHGPPTWKKVVEAVAHPAGGNDPTSAEKIAYNHQGTTATPHAYTTEYYPDFQPSASPKQIPSPPPRPDPRETHPLSSSFAMMFTTITEILNESDSPVDAIKLKKYLGFYSHPLYPEKPLVEVKIFEKAKTAGEVLESLWPQYINFMNYYLLEDIVEEFHCTEASRLLEEYKGMFNRKRKLSDLPAPLTDDEIEQSTGVKKVRVKAKGSSDEMTVGAMEEVQKALGKATGIKQACIAYAFQDPGCVILSFLLPESISHILYELSKEDLTILADSGVLKVELVGELVIENIQQYATVKGMTEPVAEGSKRGSLEHYLQVRESEMNPDQYSHMLMMLHSISTSELDKIVTDGFLTGFASHLTNWKNLALYFSLIEEDVQLIVDYCPNEDDQKYQALLYWKKHEQGTATYHTLLETLLLHGDIREVKALLGGLGPDPAALYTSQWLKKKYLAHDPWQKWKDVPKLLQFDQRVGQLHEDASDQLKYSNYFTCYETMDQFPSEMIPFSVKGLVNAISKNKDVVILIKGAPGMGKTFMVDKICHYWATGLGMRQYTLVLKVDALSAHMASTSLIDLLLHILPNNQVTTALCKWVEDRQGDNVLFILDGWNEEQENNYFQKLLSRQYLKKSAIIVSSTSSHCIQHITGECAQLDLLGLTSDQIGKQVIYYHSTDPLKAEAVLLHLTSNPDIKQLAPFPVYLYAILFISDHVSPSDLPNTWTEMFTLLTLLLMDPLFPEHNTQSNLQQYMANFPINLPDTMKSFVHILGRETSDNLQYNYLFYNQSDLEFFRRLLCSNQDMDKGFTIFCSEQTGLFKFTFPLLEYFVAAVHVYQLPATLQEQRMMQQHNPHYIWQFHAALSQHNEQFPVVHVNYCEGDNFKSFTCFYEAGLTPPTPCTDFWGLILTASEVHHVLVLSRGKENLKFQRCCMGTGALKQLSKAFAYSYPERVEGTRISFQDCKLSAEGLGCFGAKTMIQLLRRVMQSPMNLTMEHTEHQWTLSDLDLSSCSIGYKGAKVVARDLILSQTLRTLNLSNNDIPDSGAVAISDSLKVNYSLQVLKLNQNKISDVGAVAFSNSLKENHSLQKLNLNNNRISERGAVAISESLKVNHSLKVLKLGWNLASDSGAFAISETLKVNHSLQVLNLNNNRISERGAVAISESLKVNDSLRVLKLGWNMVADSGAVAISESLKVNHSLQELDLNNNFVSDRTAVAISESLKVNVSLQELNLGNNHISDGGAVAISDFLKVNHCLQVLHFNGNKISESGAIVISDSLKMNSSLKVLSLNSNGISNGAAVAISESLKGKHSLQELNLGNNYISNSGVIAISDALKVNHSLQVLTLINNGISDGGAIAISESLKVNHSLQVLNLESNLIGDGGAIVFLDCLKVNCSLRELNLSNQKLWQKGRLGISETCEKLLKQTKGRITLVL